MKYINAKLLLPQELVGEVQRYIQGGCLYVPVRDEQHRGWGELSGYREELCRRNTEIVTEYGEGSSVECLAEKYHLSVHSIRKIIHQK